MQLCDRAFDPASDEPVIGGDHLERAGAARPLKAAEHDVGSVRIVLESPRPNLSDYGAA
jgi:hypothetical protein